MAGAVIAVAASVIAEVAVAELAITGIAATFAKAAIGSVLTFGASAAFGGKAKKPDAPQFTREAQDRATAIRSGIEARRVIYGETRVSGPLVFGGSTGSSKEYLHLVVPVAGHAIKGFDEFIFNDRVSTDTAISSFLRVKSHLGALDQAADSDLVAEVSAWTANHRLRGVAYFYPRLQWNETAWPTGIPNPSAIVKGRLVWDPRATGIAIASSAAGAPGVFTTAAPHGLAARQEIFIKDHAGSSPAIEKRYQVDTAPTSTTFTLLNANGAELTIATGGTGGTVYSLEWSNNWALGVLDFHLSEFGLAADVADVDLDAFIAAANVSDEEVILPVSRTFTASAATDTLTFASAFTGLKTGDKVRLSNAGGALPAGLSAGPLFAIKTGDSAAKLATSVDNARAGTAIDITDAGTGTHTLTRVHECDFTADASTDMLTLESGFPVQTGDRVRVSSTGTLPAGSAPATDFWAITAGRAKIKLAATLADARAGIAVNLTDAGAGTHTLSREGQLRYTIDGSFILDRQPIDVLEEMLTAGAGAWVFAQGVCRIFAGAAVTPSADGMDESHLRDKIKISPRIERRELYNAVRGTFVDPANGYQPADFPPVTNATYESQDGGARIYRDVEMPWTQDSVRAQRIAKIHLEESRQAAAIDWPGNMKPLSRAVWDVVPVTVSLLGYAGKNFRIVGWGLNPDGGINLQLREYAAAVYDWNGGEASTADPAPDTGLPNPFVVAAPTNLAIASGNAELYLREDGSVFTRAKVTWTSPADAFVVQGGKIEVQYKKTADPAWQPSFSVEGNVNLLYILEVEDGAAYDIRIRSVNTLGIQSAWVSASHTIIGKTAAPANVTGFSASQNGNVVVFKWAQVADADLAGYEIRFMAAPFVWADALTLTAVTRGTQITSAGVPPGTWVFGIKARDTSANYSSSAATTSLTVVNANDVVLNSQFAPDWPAGTLTDLVVHWTGKLIPKSQSGASAGDTFDAPVPNPYPAGSYECPVQDVGFDATAVRVWGDISAGLLPGEPGSPDIAFAIDYRAAAGAFDGHENWTVGTADFRYLKAKITLNTAAGISFVDGFALTLDVAERTESADGVVIAAGGTAITFAQRFHGAPNTQVTAQAVAGAVRIATYESLTATGFTARVFNAAGTDVGGTVNWQATGA